MRCRVALDAARRSRSAASARWCALSVVGWKRPVSSRGLAWSRGAALGCVGGTARAVSMAPGLGLVLRTSRPGARLTCSPASHRQSQEGHRMGGRPQLRLGLDPRPSIPELANPFLRWRVVPRPSPPGPVGDLASLIRGWFAVGSCWCDGRSVRRRSRVLGWLDPVKGSLAATGTSWFGLGSVAAGARPSVTWLRSSGPDLASRTAGSAQPVRWGRLSWTTPHARDVVGLASPLGSCCLSLSLVALVALVVLRPAPPRRARGHDTAPEGTNA